MEHAERTARPAKNDNDDDCRCPCGNLLARLTPRGIEVKCRRCKRVVVLDLPPGVTVGKQAARGPPG